MQNGNIPSPPEGPRLLLRALAQGAGLLLLGVLLTLFWSWWAPFLLAYAAAGLLKRPVARAEAAGVPRPLVAAGMLLFFWGGAGALLWLLVRRLVQEGTKLAVQLPLHLNALLSKSGGWAARWEALAVSLPVPVQQLLDAWLDQVRAQGLALPGQLSARLSAWAGAWAAALPGALLFLITLLLGSYYALTAAPTAGGWQRLLPGGWGERLAALASSARRALSGWLRAQAALCGIITGELVLGLLCLRVPWAMLAGLLGGLVDALPVFGSGTLLVPWAALSLMEGKGGQAVGLLVLWGVTALTRRILEPHLLGKQTGLSPFATLAALYLGYRAGGLAGLILAPLLLAVAQQLITEMRQRPPDGGR